ncbi:RusA family crossover junction endodeoxyribonuclease [Rhizobium leguminosarum]|uniref:RusA family crossover junction endodeoxyribonuclease n=1 Tax=Rhizobium leguminosarum TaxID=384 RepID=UPI0015F828D0|nr:RusA family crossover junction endodeoxyribonuclease [Rhizobium leguminosarum]MBA9034953.1 Holliday junction resolvase RusA-like endonuclease [Rhizobium leguminosarum]
MTERMSAKQYREQFVEPKAVVSARILITNMPPSANGLRKSFIKEGKVISVKSDGYSDWRKAAVAEIQSQGAGRVEGPYRLSIVAQRHWRSKRARDIDNIIKPISDALVKAGVVQDDSLAECVTARWADDLQGHAAVIDVEVCL